MFILGEDVALKEILQGVTVSDDAQNPRPVRVWYGYPDVEVRDQSFPFITIDLIDILEGKERQTYGYLTDTDYLGTQTPEPGSLYTYTIPIAFDLVYQITTYARHPRHDRAIINQLLTRFPSKYGHIEVPVDNGQYSTSRHMFLDGFVKRDAVEGETGNRRLLRNVYTVRILSELSPYQADMVRERMVESVHMNTTTSYIPSDYDPVTPFVLPEN